MKKLYEPKIGTFDIETLVFDGVHTPYLYSFYDGDQTFSFFSEKPGDLTTCVDFLKAMLKPKYNAFTFYAHNFSGFDIHFILAGLSVLKTEGNRISFMKNNDKYGAKYFNHFERKKNEHQSER